MADLLYTELLKLKRSKMFLISIIGAVVAPLVVVVASYVYMKTKQPTPPIKFEELFNESSLYTVLVIGVPLYGVVTAYLFNREYMEDTLKNLLTIPVSRAGFIISKSILLFMWIMMLTSVAWGLTFILGLLGGFEGMSPSLITKSFKQFSIGGGLLFILSTPIILVTLVAKNYVPTIIFTIMITLINIMSSSSEYRGLFPWAAAGDIANQTLPPKYPPEYSYISIMATSVIGFIATVIYFKKADIH